MLSYELSRELGVTCPQLFGVTIAMAVPPILTLAPGRCPDHDCWTYEIAATDVSRITAAVQHDYAPRPDVVHYRPTPWQYREELNASEREEERRWGAIDRQDEAR